MNAMLLALGMTGNGQTPAISSQGEVQQTGESKELNFQLLLQQWTNQQLPISTQSATENIVENEDVLNQLLTDEEWTGEDLSSLEQLIVNIKRALFADVAAGDEIVRWLEQQEGLISQVFERISNLQSEHMPVTKSEWQRADGFNFEQQPWIHTLLQRRNADANGWPQSTPYPSQNEVAAEQSQSLKHWQQLVSLLESKINQLQFARNPQGEAQLSYEHMSVEKLAINSMSENKATDDVELQKKKQERHVLFPNRIESHALQEKPLYSSVPLVIQDQSEQQQAAGQQSVIESNDAKPWASLTQLEGKFPYHSPPLSGDGRMTPRSDVISSSIEDLPETLDRLIVRKFESLLQDGKSEVKIRLVPEQLGTLDVHLKMQQGNLVAEFFVDRSASKEMIEGQLTTLRTALQSHGIQVDRLEVTTSTQHHQQGFAHDHQRQQTFLKQQSQSRAKFNSEEQNWLEDYWDISEQFEGRNEQRSLIQMSSIDLLA